MRQRCARLVSSHAGCVFQIATNIYEHSSVCIPRLMLATSCNVWTLMNFAYLWMQFRSSEIICANSKGISLHHCLRGGAKRLLPPVPLMCLDTGNRRQKKEKWKLLGIAWICKFAEVSVLMFIRLDAAFRLAGYLCCLQFTQMIFSTHYGLTSVTSLLWLLYLLCMFLGNAASQCCGNVNVKYR